MRLIDADALLEKCNKDQTSLKFAVLTLILHYAPTIDAEPVKHGEWIGEYQNICSVCGKREDEFISGWGEWEICGASNYCPNCGARMKGEDDDS